MRNATVAGAVGGCQAETGVAAAMAASAATELLGGTPLQCTHAASTVLMNMLGLVCDPVGGLVEYPCQNRNAAGVANALVAAEMALAGITQLIPLDEMITIIVHCRQKTTCRITRNRPRRLCNCTVRLRSLSYMQLNPKHTGKFIILYVLIKLPGLFFPLL